MKFKNLTLKLSVPLTTAVNWTCIGVQRQVYNLASMNYIIYVHITHKKLLQIQLLQPHVSTCHHMALYIKCN